MLDKWNHDITNNTIGVGNLKESLPWQLVPFTHWARGFHSNNANSLPTLNYFI